MHEFIVVDWRFIVYAGMNDRQHDSLLLKCTVGHAKRAYHFRPSNFKVFKVSAVIDITHLVGFPVSAADRMCK